MAVSKMSPVQKQFDMRIDASGRWYHQGGLIERENLVALFASILTCDEAGQYWLCTPAEYGRIEVEDAPFLITAWQSIGAGRDQQITCIDNIGRSYRLGLDAQLFFKHPAAAPTPIPYLDLGARLTAKLARPVYYQLIEIAEISTEIREDDGGIAGLWSAGQFISLMPSC